MGPFIHTYSHLLTPTHTSITRLVDYVMFLSFIPLTTIVLKCPRFKSPPTCTCMIVYLTYTYVCLFFNSRGEACEDNAY